jgi:4'-phosphopantetheinyl transferase superfamily
MVAVAIDPFEPIGIDVERLNELPTRDLPLSALSRAERLRLDLCPSRSRYREFIKLWTLKEAHAKRLGYGVHLDFPSFDIVWQPGRDAEEIETSDGGLVTRLLDMTDAAYRLSVSLGGRFPRRPIVWRQAAAVAEIARLFAGGNNEVTMDFCTRRVLSELANVLPARGKIHSDNAIACS